MGRVEAANVDPDEARPRPSLKLGKYQLLAVLGRGGMAEVFLALSRGAMGFDKLAVIKRLRPGLADDDAFREMFLDEARLAARLNHPNVVHTYEVGEHDGVYFIAMEYLEGQALNAIARVAEKRGAPLSHDMSARIISDALAGLHHAHTLTDFDGRPLGIVHRDISPHNLFVTYEGTTKVVDFGIAKAALSSTETEVGVLKGKVAYMSPEQATAGPIDARSDVFAMGIVLWEMLTQKRLMTGDSAASTIHRLLTVNVPTVSTFQKDVPRSLDAIVECALQKDPNRRFASALAMREAIEAYLASTGRAVRTEEIGQTVGAMFTDVREAIKRQIQEHVEGAAKDVAPAPEDSQVSRSARAPREGTMVSGGELPLLNPAGGSGSGVVSKGRAGNPEAAVSIAEPIASQVAPSAPTPSAQAAGVSKATLIVGFLVLLVVVVGASAGTQLFMGSRRTEEPKTDFNTSTPPVAPTAASAVQTVTPGATALPPVASATIPAAASAAAVAPSASATTASKGTHTHHTSTTPATAAAPSPDTLGFVTFDTYPWTKVSEGGTSLGTTPLVHLALPAGSHTLTLDNPDQGIHQTYALTVKAGESVTKRLGLK
jgi:tRNA A-37 threonylcarbamoyl transferase component Bud32